MYIRNYEYIVRNRKKNILTYFMFDAGEFKEKLVNKIRRLTTNFQQSFSFFSHDLISDKSVNDLIGIRGISLFEQMV